MLLGDKTAGVGNLEKILKLGSAEQASFTAEPTTYKNKFLKLLECYLSMILQ